MRPPSDLIPHDDLDALRELRAEETRLDAEEVDHDECGRDW